MVAKGILSPLLPDLAVTDLPVYRSVRSSLFFFARFCWILAAPFPINFASDFRSVFAGLWGHFGGSQCGSNIDLVDVQNLVDFRSQFLLMLASVMGSLFGYWR